jgi:hypothetical protein
MFKVIAEAEDSCLYVALLSVLGPEGKAVFCQTAAVVRDWCYYSFGCLTFGRNRPVLMSPRPITCVRQ